MKLNTKDMIGVGVKTVSGQLVGKVLDFALDPESGRIVELRVKTKGVVAGFMAGELLVPWSAIVTMRVDGVIILDGTVKTVARTLASRAMPSSSSSFIKEWSAYVSRS